MSHTSNTKWPTSLVARARPWASACGSRTTSPLRRPSRSRAGSSATGWRSSRWRGATATLDGAPGELTFRRYQRFGAGGRQADLGRGRAPSSPKAGPTRASSSSTRPTAAALERLLETCRDGPPRGLGRRRRPARRPATDPLGPLQRPRPILAQHDPLLDPRTVVDKRDRGDRPTRLPADLRRRARPAPGPLRRGRRAGAARSGSTSSTSSSATATCSTSCSPRRTRPGQVRRLVREPDAVHPRASSAGSATRIPA